MNFKLSEEQRQLQDLVLRIAAGERGRKELRALIDGKSSWSDLLGEGGLWKDLTHSGVNGIITPECYSGLGLGMVELALVAEALGYAGTPSPFLGHALATIAIAHGGDEAQKAAWLPRMASGEILASVALSEANEGWDPREWTLAPVEGRLTGGKLNVPYGEAADLIVVGLAGGLLGLIETSSAGANIGPLDVIDLTRPLSKVDFHNAPVDMLANGVIAATRLWDAALVMLAADAFGGASRMLEMTRDYTLMREAFGLKLAQFQGIKHQLANMQLEIEPTRGLYWIAAYAFDKLGDRASHAASLAKAHASEVFLQTARLGTELHGGIGFTWEYDCHIWLKRAMFDFAWGGRPDRHFTRAADMAGW